MDQVGGGGDDEDLVHRHAAALFEPPPEIRVLGPTEFPKPTDKLLSMTMTKRNGVMAMDEEDFVPVVRVKPAYGQHRANEDAILAYAEGYKLPWYQMFMETLTATGYRGDVVLAIAEERIVSPHVVDYLKTFTVHDPSKPNLVLYQEDLDCDNNSPTNTEYYGTKHRQLTKQGDTNPFQMCRLTNFYGWKKKNNRPGDGEGGDEDDRDEEDIEPVADPREGRVVATLRYEWYWIWSLQYQPHCWLMLLDARDSFFQSNPFAHLPRSNSTSSTTNKTSGLLYFFGENAHVTRLGISKKNQQWIRRAYGDAVIEVLKDKPTICSGSTMGEQIAVESYLRAMVNEHDECNIKMMGADQGFHNYLYYSQKLIQASAIDRIVVWEQGRGIINNLGALRTKPLQDWGNLYNPETHQVFQWPSTSTSKDDNGDDDNNNGEEGEREDDDKEREEEEEEEEEQLVLSPVVHQWDRDHDLHGWMTRVKHKEWEQEWIQQHQK